MSVTPRTYDAAVARGEFDYLTEGWEDCGSSALKRIRYLMLLLAEHLPEDDPRHDTMRRILQRLDAKTARE